MNKKKNEAIVVSTEWPSNDTGHGIAAAASLCQYAKMFSKVHFFGPQEVSFAEHEKWAGMNVSWFSLPFARQPKWIQFLKSVISWNPAIVMRSRQAIRPFHAELDRIVRLAHQNNLGLVIIYVNLQPSYLLPHVERDYPEIPQAVHSLDPYVKGFEGLDIEGPLAKRLAWRLEYRKMCRFEKMVFSHATAFWTITHDDLIMYEQRLGIKPDGVIGISLSADQYSSVAPGDPYTVVHVGSADMRKGKGLRDFISEVWPLVRAEAPQARLLIGGRNTERLTDPNLGIEGLGYIHDDREVLEEGTVFVNPQQTGAGIKLKSIVAMLAGKVLVSTPVGIEGVDGAHGKHFFVENDPKGFAARIIELIRDPQLAVSVRDAARTLSTECYSEERLSEKVQPLLARFIERGGERLKEKWVE